MEPPSAKMSWTGIVHCRLLNNEIFNDNFVNNLFKKTQSVFVMKSIVVRKTFKLKNIDFFFFDFFVHFS